MALARGATSAPAVESFAFLIFLRLALSRRPLISLFALHQPRLFLENRPPRMCERIKGASNWGTLISGGAGWPHTASQRVASG